MKVLRARLYEPEQRKQEEKMAAMTKGKTDIGFGHQIRSYVLHPYRMVKDLRTGTEVGNADGVLDGALDPFIDAWCGPSSRPAAGQPRRERQHAGGGYPCRDRRGDHRQPHRLYLGTPRQRVCEQGRGLPASGARVGSVSDAGRGRRPTSPRSSAGRRSAASSCRSGRRITWAPWRCTRRRCPGADSRCAGVTTASSPDGVSMVEDIVTTGGSVRDRPSRRYARQAAR